MSIQRSRAALFAARFFLAVAVLFHLAMLGSLLSEPFELIHGIHLTGSKSHPQEVKEYRGYLDIFFHDTDRVPRGLDFFSIYQAGYNYRHGMTVYYGVRKHRFGETAQIVPYFSGFRYLPAYAFAYGSLLTIVSPWKSYWIWTCIVEILLMLNIFLIRRYRVDTPWKLLAASLWLAYSPYYVELHIGQQSMVTATLLHMTALAALNQKNGSRDIWYGLSVVWKINTIIFLPLWVKMRRWWSICLIVTATLLLAAPYFFLHPDSFHEFISYFHQKFIAVGPSSMGFWSFSASILSKSGVSQDGIRMILSIWSLAILSLSSLATLLPHRVNFLRALGLWICTYYLSYQYVWEHHYVMLLPLFTFLLLQSKKLRWVVIWFFCAIPTPYILWRNPEIAMPETTWSIWQIVIYHGMKIIPVIIAYILLLVSIQEQNKVTEKQWDPISLLTFRKDSHAAAIERHSINPPS